MMRLALFSLFGASTYAHQGALLRGGDLVLSALERVEERLQRIEEVIGDRASASHEDGSRVPTKVDANDENLTMHDLSLFERLRLVEHKVDGGLNWLKEPQLFRKQEASCKNVSNFESDHSVCLDHWEDIVARRQRSGKPEKCIVYDLGIRANPEFGMNMMKQMGCSIRAYDPSPTSVKWWNEKADNPGLAREAKAMGEQMYKFVPFGAGGTDGTVELYEYNWQQVSIYRAENDLTQRAKGVPDQAPTSFQLPVKTLPTMMKENGDSYIDVLKIDIEGSEYLFLQDAFDRMGCPPVGQIAVEWHHFSIDGRYGSSPEMNVLHNLLSSCGYKAFMNRDHWRADPEYDQGARKIPPMRYTLAAYCKDCQL